MLIWIIVIINFNTVEDCLAQGFSTFTTVFRVVDELLKVTKRRVTRETLQEGLWKIRGNHSRQESHGCRWGVVIVWVYWYWVLGIGVGDRRGGWREGAVVHFVGASTKTKRRGSFRRRELRRNTNRTSPSLNFVEPSPIGTNSTYEEIADDFSFSSR